MWGSGIIDWGLAGLRKHEGTRRERETVMMVTPASWNLPLDRGKIFIGKCLAQLLSTARWWSWWFNQDWIRWSWLSWQLERNRMTCLSCSFLEAWKHPGSYYRLNLINKRRLELTWRLKWNVWPHTSPCKFLYFGQWLKIKNPIKTHLKRWCSVWSGGLQIKEYQKTETYILSPSKLYLCIVTV